MRKPNFPAQMQPGMARSFNQHGPISPELPGVPVPYTPLATDSTGLQPHARNWARALENYKVLTIQIEPGVGPCRPLLTGSNIVRGGAGETWCSQEFACHWDSAQLGTPAVIATPKKHTKFQKIKCPCGISKPDLTRSRAKGFNITFLIQIYTRLDQIQPEASK